MSLEIPASLATSRKWHVRTGRPARLRATAGNIDHTSHANNAVHDAVVRISSRLRKGMLINKAYIANSSRKAVHIVRGTILRIGHARRTAGDTVSALGPGPPHSVAH